MTGDDAASLTTLLRDYGGLWVITRTLRGFTAQRRPRPIPPDVFTAATVAALRELLEHGYDTGKLAELIRDFGGKWEIERLDPGSAWVAVSRDGNLTRLITAGDLRSLCGKLSAESDGVGAMESSADAAAPE
jgi:hypothetical protein